MACPAERGGRAPGRSWKGTGRELFRELSQRVESELCSAYEAQLEADRAELRQQYEAEVQKMHDRCREVLQDLERRLPRPSDPAISDSVIGEAAGAAEAAADVAALSLKAGLSRLCGATAWPAEGEPLAFNVATATILRGVIEECDRLAGKAEEWLRSLRLQLAYSCLGSGDLHTMVSPAVETVAALKAKVSRELDLYSTHPRLLLRSETVEMQAEQLLMNYDLADGVSVLLADGIAPEPMLHLPFQEPEAMAMDLAGGRSGQLLFREETEMVDVMSRRGIRFMGNRAKLHFDPPVQLGQEWALCFWTLAPAAVPQGQERRVLAAGFGVPLAVSQEGRFQCVVVQENPRHSRLMEAPGFDVRALAGGWHFVAALGAGGVTRVFVDGALAATLPQQYRGGLHSFGNTDNDEWRGPFGVVSDLRIYGSLPDVERYRVWE